MNWAIDAGNRQSIRHQLIQFASVSWPGSRCIALWPDEVASVHILDNGGRLRDLDHHAHPDMIEVLQERYPLLVVGAVIYLPPTGTLRKGKTGHAMDLEDFFADRNLDKLKERL